MPSEGDGSRFGTLPAERPPTVDSVREVVQTAERRGCAALRIPTRVAHGLCDDGAPLAETWPMATARAAGTRRRRCFRALRPGCIAAGLLAQMVATREQSSRGRGELNLVPGGFRATAHGWGGRSTMPGAMRRPRS
jgi:alkanesulfonate monooxygenase SsuD/methylene tetrahydromethanopterin reductase-like flavin-dependent oxidoreductase (luciferase family)